MQWASQRKGGVTMGSLLVLPARSWRSSWPSTFRHWKVLLLLLLMLMLVLVWLLVVTPGRHTATLHYWRVPHCPTSRACSSRVEVMP